MLSKAEDFLGQEVTVRMDRPLGSKHPKHNFYYPFNYGYIPGTQAPDGEELDAYVLGVFEPREEFSGKCIAVIHRTNDDDDKLVVVPEDKDYSDEQIKALTEFQERFFESVIIR
jgi:inorganic pyrophosphatase